MDGYERNVELMQIAADSTGQADKQFEKYRDTVEFGLNRLSTKWEQFRVSIFNKDTYKWLIDIGDSLLDKLSNLNLNTKSILPFVIFAGLAAKSFVESFMNSLRENFAISQSWPDIGAMISRKIFEKVSVQGQFNLTETNLGNKAKASAQKDFIKEQITPLKEELNVLKQQEKTLQSSLNTQRQSARFYKERILYNRDSLETNKRELQETKKRITEETRLLEIQNNNRPRIIRDTPQSRVKVDVANAQELQIQQRINELKDRQISQESQLSEIRNNITVQENSQQLHEREIVNLKEQEKQLSEQIKNTEEQIAQKESERAQIQGSLTKVDNILNQTLGGTGAVGAGVVTGLQQISGALGFMAVSAISGAKATDVLKMSFMALIPMLVSRVIPTIHSIRASIAAQKTATEAWNKVTQSTYFQQQLMNGLTEEQILLKAEEAAATGMDTAAKETNTLATEAHKVAQEADNAAMTAGIALYSGLAIAAALLVAGLVYGAIKLYEWQRSTKLAHTEVGILKEKISDTTKSLETISEELSKASEEAKNAKENFELLKDAEDYIGKNYLNEEELTEWLSLQQKIAEAYPNLISRYNEEGQAIIDNTSYWIEAKKAKEEYYEKSSEEAALSLRGRQLETQNAQNEYDLGQAVDFFSVSQYLDLAEYYAKNVLGFKENLGRYDIFASLKTLSHDSPENMENYTATMEAIRAALDYEGIQIENLDELSADELLKALQKKAKDKNWYSEVWEPLIEKLSDESYINNLFRATEGDIEVAQSAQDEAARTFVEALLREDSKFTDKDSDYIDILAGYLMDTGVVTSGMEDYQIEDAIKKNETVLKSSDLNVLKQAQELYSDSLADQYTYLKENLDEDSAVLRGFANVHQDIIQLSEDNENSLKKMLGYEDDEIVQDNDILNLYNQLGEKAKNNFLEGFSNKSVEGAEADAQAYYNEFSKYLIENLNNSDALDFITSYNFSDVDDINKKSKEESFVASLLTYDPSITESTAQQIFNDLYNQAKKYSSLFDFKELTKGSYDATTESIDAISEVVASHSKILQQYAGYASGEAIKITQTQGKSIQKLIDDLTDSKKGGLDKNLFGDILDFDKKSNQYLYNRDKLTELISEHSLDILESAKQSGFYDEKELKLLQAQISALEINLGLRRSIEDTISNFGTLSSAFTSAAKEQIEEGYLSASSIKSLLDSAASMGLDVGKMSGFIDNAMHFDIKGAYQYLDAQIKILEAQSNLSTAEKEQLVIWQAYKKELQVAMVEISEDATKQAEKLTEAQKKATEAQEKATEAQKSANEAAESVTDALKKYDEQLEEIEKKQKALNETLEEFNKFLYGDPNRETGLDKLYNYANHIDYYNSELERAKDLLSDAGNVDDATKALQRYSKATHETIKYEKAKQEAIRRGLEAQAAQLEGFIYTYNNPEGGPATSVRFGDYIRKDSTGLYSINQVLLDRANFNDSFKKLLEEQVEEYNKYANELLESEDNVRKLEKEFQEQRAAAIKAYAEIEKNIADALKENYEEEVDDLKDKYDAMKEADDDYIDALEDAINKQRKLREREKKYEDLAKKEKKLSLISRDTSGTNQIQRQQLEQEIENDRESLLDEAIDDIIEGMKELYEQQEENRETELELKEALVDNTQFWYGQAESVAAGLETAEDYMELMASLDKEFAMSTLAMREDQLNTWRDEYQGAIQYTAIQTMDATSETGDFIVDTITVTGDEIVRVVAETSDAYADEVITAFDTVTEAFQEDMEKQIESINSARDALAEAVEKLSDFAKEADEAAEKARKAQEEANKAAEEARKATEEALRTAQAISEIPQDPANSDNGSDPIPRNPAAPSESLPSNVIDSAIQGSKVKAILTALDMTNSSITTKEGLISMLQRNKDAFITGNKSGRLLYALEASDPNFGGMDRNVALSHIAAGNGGIVFDALIRNIQAFKTGGLVNYTGPAWVDGTPSAPEAFLNAEDTRRIGEAARILSNLPIFNSYGEATESVINNNTTGDISIEINLNVDKLSSDIDIDEMLNRVKDEIVSVARPVGINTILQQ